MKSITVLKHFIFGIICTEQEINYLTFKLSIYKNIQL
jgi:hypothetical protein